MRGVAGRPEAEGSRNLANNSISSEQEPSVPDLISVPEAAHLVGLHADTLYRLCRTGQFPPALQIGARWRVSVPRLEKYLHGEDDTK